MILLKNFLKNITLIAKRLAEDMVKNEYQWLQNKKFYETELGTFINFIQMKIRRF